MLAAMNAFSANLLVHVIQQLVVKQLQVNSRDGVHVLMPQVFVNDIHAKTQVLRLIRVGIPKHVSGDGLFGGRKLPQLLQILVDQLSLLAEDVDKALGVCQLQMNLGKCPVFEVLRVSRWDFKDAITYEVVAFGVPKKVHAFEEKCQNQPLFLYVFRVVTCGCASPSSLGNLY
jgi:hypothetical protein